MPPLDIVLPIRVERIEKSSVPMTEPGDDTAHAAGFSAGYEEGRLRAEWEAGRLIEFAVSADDPRMDGGFYFGRSGDRWEPFINPVSAAFALQALALWSGAVPADRHLLI